MVWYARHCVCFEVMNVLHWVLIIVEQVKNDKTELRGGSVD